jgi:hypothetical protein
MTKERATFVWKVVSEPKPLSRGSAALTFVISTEAKRSGEICGFF